MLEGEPLPRQLRCAYGEAQRIARIGNADRRLGVVVGDLRGVGLGLTVGDLDQGVSDLCMEADAPGRRELAVDGFPHEGVRKGESLFFLDDELAVERLVEGVEQLLLCESHNLGNDVRRERRPDDRADDQHLVGRGRQPAELPPD